jgi:hypothetical protein
MANKTRQDLINEGKIWQVYPDGNNENIIFEGTKSACFKYLRDNKQMRQYKCGEIRVGRLIWEDLA